MNYNSNHKYKILYLLIISIVCIFIFSSVGTAETTENDVNTNLMQQNNYDYSIYNHILSTINDGYLSDDNEETNDFIRVVDFSIAGTEVPAKSTVESEIIISNYGVETIDDVKIEPIIIQNDETHENYGEEIDEEDFELTPKPYYEDIELTPGEHKKYSFDFRFEEENQDYKIAFINEEKPENRHMATKEIEVGSESSGTSISFIEDREQVSKDNVSVTRFKDENVERSSRPGASTSLPPVEKDEDGTITDTDVAIGVISDFGNIRSDSSIYGTISNSTGEELNVGFNSENVPNDNHYAISLLYELENINSAELNVVTSTGEELDEDSSYYIGSEDNTVEERVFQLTEKEIDYTQSQGEIYFTIDNVDASSSDVEVRLYDMNTIALDNVWNLPDEELEVTLDSDIEVAEVGDSVPITAEIDNIGSVSVNDDFRLYEIQAASDSRTVDIATDKIINPGDSKTLNFNAPVSSTGTHEFELLGSTIEIEVEEEGEGSIRPSINSDADVVSEGDEVNFNVEDVDEEHWERIESIEWRFESDGEYQFENERNVEWVYDEEGSYPVTLKTEYMDGDGNLQTHRTQTIVDVISGPDPVIGVTQYEFLTDDQELRGESAGSSVGGELQAGTCESSCGGSFSFDGVGLAVSQGINMLVFEVDEESNDYDAVHYGTYDVVDDGFARADDVSAEDMGNIRDAMSDGGTEGATEALVNDISNNKGEDRYFVFTSGGNPQPADNSNDLYRELNNIGADLSDENNLEENSMWTFATQTLDNGESTPLHESYVPASSGEPSISNEYSVEPVDMTESESVIPNRPVHYDLEQMELVGDIDDAEIVWELDDETLLSDQEYVSETYSTDETEHTVNVTVVDDLGLEDMDSKTVNTATSDPVASIPDNIVPSVDNDTTLYSLNSNDQDSTLSEYEWNIEVSDENEDGEDVNTNLKNPIHMWNYAGIYDVELTVTDRYGNTNTTSDEIQVIGSPPESEADIKRVMSNYNPIDETSIDTGIQNKPILYYPLDLSDGITQEYANSFDGIENGNLNTVEGFDENDALELNGESYIHVPENGLNPVDEQVSISAWVKTNQDGTIYTSDTGHSDSFTLQVSDSESDFTVTTEDEEIGLDFNSDINNDEWNHVVATYDVVEGINLYVNGELDNSNNQEIGSLNLDSSESYIGVLNADSNYFTGEMSDVHIYNKRLENDDIETLYEHNSESFVDVSYQGVFYDKGEEYKDIIISDSMGDGVVEPRENHYNIVADSTEVDSLQSMEVRDIDYSQYETIYMSYNAEFTRELSFGENITGEIFISTETNKNEIRVKDDMNAFRNGVLKLDVSEIDSTESLYIGAESDNSNLGRTSLEVYDIWGETESEGYNMDITDFYNNVYPDISENVNIHESRTGVLFSHIDIDALRDSTIPESQGMQHNIIPVGEATEIDIMSDITNMDLYADNSGSYSLGTGSVEPEYINVNSDSKYTTIDNTMYSHVGLETELLGTNSLVESLRVKSNTDSTMYPKVNFDARESQGSGEGIYVKNYEWDLSTDTSFNSDYVGPEFTHEFDEIGIHEVALRTTDTQGESNTEIFEFEVSNLRPTVNAQFTTGVDLGEDATFTANTDSEGEADIEQTIWDMGDGNFVEGENIQYEYATAGTYDVTVITIDEAGLTDSDSETINVNGDDPEMNNVPNSTSVHVMDTLLFDTTGEGFDIVEGEHPIIAQNIVDLTDIEDPNNSELSFNWVYDGESIFNEETIDEIVTNENDFQVQVTAQNEERRQSSETIDVNVHNDGPEINMNINTPIRFDDGEIIFEDSELENEDIEYQENTDGMTYVSVPVEVEVNTYHFHPRIGGELTVDMGDGNVETHIVPEDTSTGYTHTFEHEFDVPAEEYQKEDFPVDFDVEAVIEDDFGATATDDASVNVELREIETDLLVNPREAVVFQDELEFQPVNINAPDSDISVYNYDFDNGESTTRTNRNAVSHEYFREGTYQPKLTIEDEYGQVDEAVAQIRILVDFDDVIFLACGIQDGAFGPDDEQCQDTYSGTQLAGWVEVINDNGVQEWTVPQTGVYEIHAAGADGGGNSGGEGAVVQLQMQLDRGQELNIVSGLMGSATTTDFTSGGGGTFVVDENDNPIIIAGGGGGATRGGYNQDANLGERGQDARTSGTGHNQGSGAGGAPGQGGTTCDNSCAEGTGAGAGLESDGGINGRMSDRARSYSFNTPLKGGNAFSQGGFGGGGASISDLFDRAGGGGGYSGGGSATGRSWAAAGGGGSYIPNDAQIIATGHYSEFNTPNEVNFEGTGYLDIDIIDTPEVELDIRDGNDIIRDNDTITQGSELELNANYDSRLADAPESTRVWYISDGSEYEANSATHQFDETGEYFITVESIDGNGIPITQDTISIDVE